ncbi:MAG: hypothetical protein ACFHU9_03995 [Fluviicola sp.]
MSYRTKFPDLSDRLAGAMSSDGEGIKTGVIIDGMEVMMDKKVRATPVDLDYKKKRKVVGRK